MEVVDRIKEKFTDKIEKIYIHNERRAYIDLKDKRDIREVANFMFQRLKLRFNTASALDVRKHMEILYHFSFDDKGQIISIRVKIDKENLEIDSITPLFKAAEWIEREIWEMLGVNFIGHPNLKRLLLSEDWPEGEYPLRQR